MRGDWWLSIAQGDPWNRVSTHVPKGFAILVQTGAALWWAAGVNARVEQLERQVIGSAPREAAN